MDTLPLPPRPDLDQYRKRAKSLAAAATSRDPDAVGAWARAWLTALTRALGWEVTPFIQDSFDRAVDQVTNEAKRRVAEAHRAGGSFTLADAQFLIAQAHASTPGPDSRTMSGGMTVVDPAYADFEAAADAIVGGDLGRSTHC
jgi:hypothetical protein